MLSNKWKMTIVLFLFILDRTALHVIHNCVCSSNQAFRLSDLTSVTVSVSSFAVKARSHKTKTSLLGGEGIHCFDLKTALANGGNQCTQWYFSSRDAS